MHIAAELVMMDKAGYVMLHLQLASMALWLVPPCIVYNPSSSTMVKRCLGNIMPVMSICLHRACDPTKAAFSLKTRLMLGANMLHNEQEHLRMVSRSLCFLYHRTISLLGHRSGCDFL